MCNIITMVLSRDNLFGKFTSLPQKNSKYNVSPFIIGSKNRYFEVNLLGYLSHLLFREIALVIKIYFVGTIYSFIKYQVTTESPPPTFLAVACLGL